MARALWKGDIAFGLVTIPVELDPAEDRKTFKFLMLDKRDLSPVGYKRFSKTSGKEVEWANIVKGYEYQKDQYVVLSDEDFRRANVKATQTIDIRAFVSDDEVPPEYFETPYYLAPGKRGQKVYALLRETLKATHRIAVAQVVIRTAQHLAAVIPNGRALMLVTLRYPDELRSTSGIALPPENLKAAGISAKEIELAKRLVDDMTEHWNPSKYKDTYHDDLMTRIKQKIKLGQTNAIPPPTAEDERAPRSAQIIDLADLLKQSLGRGSPTSKIAVRSESPAQRGKPALRVVVAAKGVGKRTAKAAARTAVRRKRA